MKIGFALIMCWVVGSTNLSAQKRLNSLPDTKGGYLSFYLDNDKISNKDANYTNGVRLSWISDARNVDQLGGLQRALRPFTGDETSPMFWQKIAGLEADVAYNYGVSLTQLMFTPVDDLSVSQPIGQRRYAGWLGLEFSLHAKDHNTLNTASITVGMTGDNSLARSAQNWVHDTFEIEKFRGWDNQIPNSVTLDADFMQKHLIEPLAFKTGSFRFDALAEWGGRLGTFQTSAHMGTMVRAGWHLPQDYSDPRLSLHAYGHKYFTGAEDDHSWSFYGLAGVTGKAVAFDATLDGPLWTNFETGNQKEFFVGELYYGFGLGFRNLEFSVVKTLRTSEFSGQGEFTRYGSAVIRMHF